MATTTQPLSEVLRDATRPQHEHAETRSFVSDLMGGRLGRAAYVDLARQHHAIYTALEGAGDRLVGGGTGGDPVAAAFVLPELRRVPSLEADLATLAGPTWRKELPVLAATETYVARLEGIADAATYLAHAYTRYLGDLSGGQAIARMLQRHYGMTADDLTFYTFTGIEKVKPFKDRYRALIDDAAFASEQRDRVVEEAKVAFDLNAAVFVALGERHVAAAEGGRETASSGAA
ncbi:heme oxygenase (biliverdin-producing) [Georgenia sp. Z1491]|uniref:biliverdin-producing heme oxygenase n=1 Tax=Georgenia sp. Z1491 TaxID=3416707 RepID=UPI003CF9F675